MSISENIKRMRDERDWTQRQLADRVGTTAQTVSNWESGSQPSGGWIPRIAAAFGVEIIELYSDRMADL